MFSNSSEFFNLEPGLYPSLADTVEAMNTFIQERHNSSDSCIKVKVSRRTHKLEIYLAIEGCGLAFFSTDMEHIFGSKVGNEFGVLLRGRGPRKPKIAYGVVRKHPLMIHMDLPDWIQKCWQHERLVAALFSYTFKAQSWRHNNFFTVSEQSDFQYSRVQTAAQHIFS